MDLYERYGYISFDSLKSLPEGQKFRHIANPPICEACIAGKSIKPLARRTEKPIWSNQPLERIHADLIGPFNKEWLGKKYTLTMMDDFSRYCIAIPIRSETDTTGYVKEWVKILGNQVPNSKKVQSIQADWGGEFRNKDLVT